ncbi:hypothetical protein BOX15_Mlig002466g8 [Macrostomum lignano]|uniref:Ketoreductase domain-containing protein n=1 Tax=Macrostomum lignano TaxID=282301 RepID=A0A267FXS8_9PLAT|nr:hypothetical protein BOX15_Mlig002466g8 [Macrostomum lignano]
MAALLKSVTGLRVMVTGGASGLGAATATQLLNRGARVLIVDVAESNPTTKAGFCRADITDESGVASAMSVAEKQLGGLDAVVNCAGEGLAARMYNWNNDTVFNQDDFRRLLRVNALGTFNVCRLAAQLMAKNQPAVSAAGKDKKAAKKSAAATDADAAQRGVIVNTSSLSAFDGQATQTMYSASKAAVAAMTLPLSRDLAPLGIRVCCIAPGYFDSPMCVRESYPPRVLKFLADHNRAIYRLGRPTEFADAVETILLNPMLNGVCLRLDSASRGFFYHRRQKAVPLVARDAPATVEDLKAVDTTA